VCADLSRDLSSLHPVGNDDVSKVVSDKRAFMANVPLSD